ncbi:hypothetical protein D9757_003485 [Collybiopsis confluens]|uniref:Pet127-domain-containing protein n=1 Tax=Collybiopsis confluens TaxID=2823264 RepID=A0A8H5MD32_9AGAR|nr:hypothetical protein D9757_003485 [Collybiopsis confluens]
MLHCSSRRLLRLSLPCHSLPRNRYVSLLVEADHPTRSTLSARLSKRFKTKSHADDSTKRNPDALIEAITAHLGTPKEKKKKKKKKKSPATVEQPVTKPADIEGWEEGWGEDDSELVSDTRKATPVRGSPPHLPFPTDYSRRVEGLLEDTPKTVLQDLISPTNQHPIATLHHGLDRVLFNPGVHWLRDPRSRVYNFPPALGIIPKVFDFAFERLTGFVRSSRDQDLWALARQEDRKFAGSTSSLSGMLCHLYFLLSGNKTVDTSTLGMDFRREGPTFTPGQRMPATVVFNYNDGVYSIDSSSSKSSDNDKNILLWMGVVLEKYLTMSSEDFLSFIRSHPYQLEKMPEEPTREAYRYSKSDKFVMRSQLDCHDTRLPGTGVFDIKTRACLPIRMDLLNFKENSGYIIRRNNGYVESFEREYYDLIRAAFLKYQFQVRIGNMDGVFVAYHNTARMFGFQYVSLEEMDQRLFGPAPGTGDRVFQKCVEMLELVSEEIVSCFPGQSVKCTFETEEGLGRDLNIWVEPYSTDVEDGENKTQGPIKQLTVSAESYYGETPSKGARCVGSMDEPWTVHWTISHLASGPEREADVRSALQAAYDRQYRAHNLPDGVTQDKIREWWESVDFSGQNKLNIPILVGDDEGSSEGLEVSTSTSLQPANVPDEFFASNFVEPDERIRGLRNLARAGRAETIKIGLEDKGKPKVVFGVGEVDWEDTLLEEEIAIRDAAEKVATETLVEEKEPT